MMEWKPTKEILEGSLAEFCKAFWLVNNPSHPLQWNWHLDAICEHLEAVSRGEIKRLLVNVPPRSSKSSIISVLWPAWVWTKKPGHQFLCVSHGANLATRDTSDMRNIIMSDEYQAIWPVSLASDENMKTRFSNEARGRRVSFGILAKITGEGGDTIIIDDPLDATQTPSDVQRQAVLEAIDEKISTRVNDPATSSIVMVMQRLHSLDPAGHALEQGGWDHLCIPMRFEPDHPHLSKTVLDWKDPRTEDGELLWPERFSGEFIDKWASDMGAYGAAGQLQQRPAPRTGGLFMTERFQLISEERLPKEFDAVCRYWDKASTEGDGDWTVGVLMARKGDRFFVLDMVRGQWSPGTVEDHIDLAASVDDTDFGDKIKIGIEQEGGSSGKAVSEFTRKRLRGYRVFFESPTGAKEVRAEPYAIAVENYEVYLKKAAWNRAFIEEHQLFPMGAHDDIVDAAGGAYRYLAKPRRKLIA